MALQAPPDWIVSQVGLGWYRDFINRVIASLREPVSVSSWFRDPLENLSVGGDSVSQHLIGLAFDLVPASGDMRGLGESMQAYGLIAVDEGDHLHVQRFAAGEVASFIRALFPGTGV